MCAEFAASTTSGTKAVNVWVFGRVIAIALTLNDLTIWVRLRKLFIMTNGACITVSCILHFPSSLEIQTHM